MHPVEDPETTFEYYNNSSDYGRHDAAEFMEQVRQSPDHWAHSLIADMQAALRDRRVLEVACGYGRWTRFVAEVAEHIVATDYAPKNLALGVAQGLSPDRVEFRLADAFEIEQVEGTFDAGLHMNFISHVSKARADAFLDAFHRKLGSGSVVFMGGDQCGEAWMRKIYTKRVLPTSSPCVSDRMARSMRSSTTSSMNARSVTSSSRALPT